MSSEGPLSETCGYPDPDPPNPPDPREGMEGDLARLEGPEGPEGPGGARGALRRCWRRSSQAFCRSRKPRKSPHFSSDYADFGRYVSCVTQGFSLCLLPKACLLCPTSCQDLGHAPVGGPRSKQTNTQPGNQTNERANYLASIKQKNKHAAKAHLGPVDASARMQGKVQKRNVCCC